MSGLLDENPNLGGFPQDQNDLKINNDIGNRKHGDHFDVMQSIPGGTEQTRIDPIGNVKGGTTNIGPKKMDW